MPQSPRIDIIDLKEEIKLTLQGSWEALEFPNLINSLKGIPISLQKNIKIDLNSLTYMDTTGSYLLNKFLKQLDKKGICFEIEGGTEAIRETIKIVQDFKHSSEEKVKKAALLIQLLNYMGKKAQSASQSIGEALSFLGEVTVTFLQIMRHPRRFRLISLIDLIHKVGVSALPIVGLISFLIGIVLVYQGADQLRRFGAEIFTINLLTVSALRELGILLTAIVVAGRSGSAYTAQLGFMKLNQEIDALVVLGFNPLEVLVIPRILALVITLPLLTFFSDIMALIGGGITTYFLLGIGPADFTKHLLLSIKPWTFWTGIIKAPLFAYFIALTACYEGFRVSGGAESVGQHTTQSVVESIFLVLIMDAAFSIIFSYLRI